MTTAARGKSADDFTRLDSSGLNDPAVLDEAIEVSVRQPEGDGAVRCYHGQTRGCIVDGILRRVDPYARPTPCPRLLLVHTRILRLDLEFFSRPHHSGTGQVLFRAAFDSRTRESERRPVG